LRKQASYIFLIRFIRLAIAVLNLSFSAKYFGISLERDVWLLAYNAILIFDIAIWAPLNDTFRAKFLQIKKEAGEQPALDQTKGLLFFINLITLGLVILIMAFAKSIASILAPDYHAEQLTELTFMIRLLAPTFLINQFTKILTSILNTYNSFIIPEVTGLISQIFILVVIITLVPTLGIASLAISYYGSLGLLLLLLLAQLRKHNIQILSGLLRSNLKQAKPFVLFSLPFFLPHFFSQLNQIVEKSLASTIVGAVSILDYSRKFSDIPIEVLIGIFISMLVPMLTSRHAERDREGFLSDFKKIYQFGFLIVTVVIGMLTGCSPAIVDFLYKKGSISGRSLQQISELSTYYSWAGFGIFLYYAFGLSLLSSGKGRLFAIYGTMAQIIMIGINLIVFKHLITFTFPLSLGISHIVAAVIMACYFPVKVTSLYAVTLKYTLLVVATAIGMFLINHFVISFQHPIAVIITNMFVLTLILGMLIFVVRLEERSLIISYLKKWMSRLS
jgi:putative peptidoglycan lipid II flippase